MTGINDNDTYLRKMRNTFKDKAWWVKNIPEDVDTIVDFGCADGSFIRYLKERKLPVSNYVGVEGNHDFLEECKAKGIPCFESLDEAVTEGKIDPSRSLLVLNSVLHEVAYYNGSIQFLFYNISTLGFKYIVIRDMMAGDYGLYSSRTEKELKEEIWKHHDLEEKLKDFRECHGDIHDGRTAIHFLLKYFYDENWSRECQENYLSLDYGELNKLIRETGYDIRFQKFYALPYLIGKWKKDFNADENKEILKFLGEATTHFRMFIMKGE